MIILGIAACLMLAACGGGDNTGKTNTGTPKPAPKARNPVPPEYKGKTNPTPNAVAEGAALFKTHCVSCHGEKGDGDSPTGKSLNPQAGDLTSAEFHDNVQDDYIFWHITVGAKAGPPGSAMTVFEPLISEEERWQVVAYLRSLRK